MNVPQTNLVEFIGKEENNLLASMITCHTDIVIAFAKLDGIFQGPIPYLNINAKDECTKTILTMYLLTHYQLYFSTVCLLRCHLSESLASTRKAIDAALTAYRLIEEPETLDLYLDRHRSYQGIKGYIDRARKKDDTRFPLSKPLIHFHEVCSEFGSHVDVSSLLHRLIQNAFDEKGKGLFRLNMFQTPDTEQEMRRYMVETFLAFGSMLKVFSSFVGDLAKGLQQDEWAKAIDDFVTACYSEGLKLDEAITAATEAATKQVKPT
jgi:hypothetical protein